MQWIEESCEGEVWRFNQNAIKASDLTEAPKNERLPAPKNGDMVQILANRLMEGKISLALKRLGLGSFTVCDVRGDPGPEFDAIKAQGSGKSIMFLVSVNNREKVTLKQRLKQISDEGFPVMMFSAREQYLVPNRG